MIWHDTPDWQDLLQSKLHQVCATLLHSHEWEQRSSSRHGAVLVAHNDTLRPIVWTTTLYHKPSQILPVHHDLIKSAYAVLCLNHDIW